MSELTGPAWTQSREKRRQDVAIASGLLPLVIAVGGLAAAAVGVVDRMNPVFRQTRYTTGLQPFILRKLRTMPEATIPISSMQGADDDRATRLGHFLRRTHVDELPQLFNVLGGSMSIVGPRPLPRDHTEMTLDILSPFEQREWIQSRTSAKPGIVGPYTLLAHQTNYQMHNLYDRAMSDIEYACTATRAGDSEIMKQCATTLLSIGKTRHALQNVSEFAT